MLCNFLLNEYLKMINEWITRSHKLDLIDANYWGENALNFCHTSKQELNINICTKASFMLDFMYYYLMYISLYIKLDE